MRVDSKRRTQNLLSRGDFRTVIHLDTEKPAVGTKCGEQGVAAGIRAAEHHIEASPNQGYAIEGLRTPNLVAATARVVNIELKLLGARLRVPTRIGQLPLIIDQRRHLLSALARRVCPARIMSKQKPQATDLYDFITNLGIGFNYDLMLRAGVNVG